MNATYTRNINNQVIDQFVKCHFLQKKKSRLFVKQVTKKNDDYIYIRV